MYFHLPALVIFWSAWALYTLFDRYGPSLELGLLPFIGFDPRLVGRQIRRMMQPRHWNVQELVMFFLVQRARQADAMNPSHRSRRAQNGNLRMMDRSLRMAKLVLRSMSQRGRLKSSQPLT
ncbi:hypothetical protein BDV93DRAFT_41000 [Ceratobasidium sp. AG-I]|nr:hypothetical protein BDV93DRAFT_41000 [Ceratobasidium sp. AG-I]